MTQREKYLSIGVGIVLGLGALQLMVNRYRSTVTQREARITLLTDQNLDLERKQIDGALADRQMGEYVVRSLPGDPERARSVYQKWLLNLVDKHEVAGAAINATMSIPVGDLYRRFSFDVKGNAGLPQFIDLLHGFYGKDYLHRIRDFAIAPARDKEGMDFKMTVDAIVLLAAPQDAAEPSDNSWRVDPNLVAYRQPILNRNFFEPPNKAPKYEGSPSIEAFVAQDSTAKLSFQDPEGGTITFEFVSQPPDFIKLDESGELRVNADTKQEIEIEVRASDDGYPQRSVEQKLTVKVVDPPPPAPPKPEFDDAAQTYLTGLVQGADEWTAWINVRTRAKTLKLQVGDGFEIGSMKGKVVELTARYAILESNGKRFKLQPDDNLADAAKESIENDTDSTKDNAD